METTVTKITLRGTTPAAGSYTTEVNDPRVARLIATGDYEVSRIWQFIIVDGFAVRETVTELF